MCEDVFSSEFRTRHQCSASYGQRAGHVNTTQRLRMVPLILPLLCYCRANVRANLCPWETTL